MSDTGAIWSPGWRRRHWSRTVAVGAIPLQTVLCPTAGLLLAARCCGRAGRAAARPAGRTRASSASRPAAVAWPTRCSSCSTRRRPDRVGRHTSAGHLAVLDATARRPRQRGVRLWPAASPLRAGGARWQHLVAIGHVKPSSRGPGPGATRHAETIDAWPGPAPAGPLRAAYIASPSGPAVPAASTKNGAISLPTTGLLARPTPRPAKRDARHPVRRPRWPCSASGAGKSTLLACCGFPDRTTCSRRPATSPGAGDPCLAATTSARTPACNPPPPPTTLRALRTVAPDDWTDRLDTRLAERAGASAAKHADSPSPEPCSALARRSRSARRTHRPLDEATRTASSPTCVAHWLADRRPGHAPSR